MATLTYLCKIGSTDITSYLKGYEVSYEELWTEANRNMAGNLKATFIGTIPKISLTFRHLTKAEMSTVLGLLNTHTFTVSWWEEGSDVYKEASFYRGELKTGILNIAMGLYVGMSVNLIGFNKL